MALTSKQRYGAFFIGVGLGSVLAVIYFTIRGLPQPPVLPEPGVIRRQVPGAVSQWMSGGMPITGAFVLSQADSRAGGGSGPDQFSRFVVVTGLDPGAYIRIEEISNVRQPDKVTAWKFMFADQVRAQLLPNADTHAMSEEMAKLGWHFAGGKDKDGWALIALKEHDAMSVAKAQLQLQQWPQWVAKTEPDYLPAPAAPGANGPGM
ncbi:MAG TPA: hypothetical protein VHC95_11635 [Opitutales bacterium]|nr:hypothetical protein [Opitutales bacterium]